MSFSNKNTIDEQVEKALRSKVDKAIVQGFGERYADTLKERIVKRTRLGVGIGTNRNSEKLKPLQDDYKKVRRDNKIRLASTTKPARSNVTATGQLLNSLTTVKIKIENGVKYLITVSDRRGRDLSGNPSKIGNKRLVTYLERQGRKFLGFTKPQINEITRDIRRRLINLLK